MEIYVYLIVIFGVVIVGVINIMVGNGFVIILIIFIEMFGFFVNIVNGINRVGVFI